MNTEQQLRERIAQLEAELERSNAVSRLSQAADDELEVALRDRLPLDQTLSRMMPVLGSHVQATSLWVRTYDESLALKDFSWSAAAGATASIPREEIFAAVAQGQAISNAGEGLTVVGQGIDVAGTFFGAAAVAFARPLAGEEISRVRESLNAWCETLDNYLAAIAMARRKHELVTSFAEALKKPVLAEGLDGAIALLREEIGVDDLILAYRHHEDAERGTLTYKIIKEDRVLYDSRTKQDAENDAFIQEHGIDLLLHGEIRPVAERFGLAEFHDEVLISGMRPDQIVGRLLVARTNGVEFSTFDRDLLHRFADFLRLRVVDFNREWRHLALCFPRSVVRRLLSEQDYAQRFLLPRVQPVAVLYTDIVGFTRVSEQILKDPPLIGTLVNAWSQRVVQIIWELDGVFDKMVGDCIIGLWGPPFFELSAQDASARAARAAIAIRDYTRDLRDSIDLPQLRQMDTPLGVATGLNYCPLFVGRFGPNEGYTGFSSGMNNTARLQGVAGLDEIFCMQSFVEALDPVARFGDEQQAQVKNVAEPLRYRPLLEMPSSSS